MESKLEGVQHSLDFVLAGKALFTIKSLKTEKRFTYRVTKAEKGTLWFVSLLTGPQNTNDYTYLGVIRGNKQFSLTAKSKMDAKSVPVVAFSWFLCKLVAGVNPPDTEIWHSGHCGRCGKTLTVPESVSSGFGPECITKVGVGDLPHTTKKAFFTPVPVQQSLTDADLIDADPVSCSYCGEGLPHCGCYWKAEFSKREAVQEQTAFLSGL